MIESRTDVEKRYKVSSAGRIRSAGKFMGQMLFVPYLWDQIRTRKTQKLKGGETYLELEAMDKVKFPELNNVTGVYIYQDDFGYVHCHAEEV